MPARAFVIRYPNGDFEYDVTRRPVPSIGDTIRRKGLRWIVTRIKQEIIAIVEVQLLPVRAASRLSASHAAQLEREYFPQRRRP